VDNRFGNMLKRFIGDETGAVAIDWVILTAGIVVMSIAAISLFRVEDRMPLIPGTCINGQFEINSMPDDTIMTRFLHLIRIKVSGHNGYIFTGNGCPK